MRGRVFTDRDTLESTRVTVVDESLVSTMFPNQDPIGKRIAFETQPGTGEPDRPPVPLWREIVGVVRHVRHYGLAGGPPFVQLYTPLRQPPNYFDQRPPSPHRAATCSG